jgi:hypothetical protein
MQSNIRSGVLRLSVEKAIKLPKGLFGNLTNIDPYIKIRFDDFSEYVARGRVKEKAGYDPIFNETFELPLTGQERAIRIEIWDENVLKNTELASVFLSIDDLIRRSQSHAEWFSLQSKTGNVAGEILLRGEIDNRMQQGFGQQQYGSNMGVSSGYGQSNFGQSNLGQSNLSTSQGTLGQGSGFSNVPHSSMSGVARGEHVPNEPLGSMYNNDVRFQQK